MWHHAIACFPTFGSSPASHSCYVELVQALEKLALTLSPSPSARDLTPSPAAAQPPSLLSVFPVIRRLPPGRKLPQSPLQSAARPGLPAELSTDFLELELPSHLSLSPAQGYFILRAGLLLTDAVL